ncbi:MAG: dihydroorotate dehydrogenase, partial [Treponema sp.]|nr:dihydroorotate dehydrogenase [Treponema sp.]
VFHVENDSKNPYVEFLILKKGAGTAELCSLDAGNEVQLLGPLGNTFKAPAPDSSAQQPQKKICIIGGGIGVAPVASFASSLPEKSYDLFASFKSGSYGLEYVKPEKLTVTTDDGSAGIKGILPAAIDEKLLAKNGYEAVYACGPAPMLAYVKQIAEKAGIQCYLSMESRMACGMGVCLGCTIETTEGLKKCCSDGPVFDSKILKFEKPAASACVRRSPLKAAPDLSVKIAGISLKNPVIAASGAFGFGTEYKTVFDVSRLGGICSKGLTLEPRQGNSGIRLWETPSGLINSIGLNNPGVKHFIENEMPEMLKLGTVAIANLSGSTLETYAEAAKLLDSTPIPLIELNISCPNVKKGGAAWGLTCESAAAAVETVKEVTKKPIAVKLTPAAANIAEIALACIEAGADALVIANTFTAVAIDIESGRPVFNNIKAGLSGPAIRPLAVKNVYDVALAVNTLPKEKQVPIIGSGGIAEWQDAVEFIMAGATAVEVGAGTFINPLAMISIIEGLSSFMQRKGFSCIEDFRGCAL